MSREAVAAFLEEAKRDPDLQKEITALAAKHGYDFTSDELNEADLADVAGGVAKKKPAKKRSVQK